MIDRDRLSAGYLESERNGDYAIGLNSRVNQYAEKHLLMLDLDSIDEPAIERLSEYGGCLLRSGRGYSTLRILESPAKPQRPMMIRMV
jgi:hypothetical protein